VIEEVFMSIAMELQDRALAFDKVVPRTEPFPHFVSPQFYTPSFADTLLTWLEAKADWQLKETVLFEQYQIGLTDFKHCEEIRSLWDGAVLARMRDQVSRAFGVPLSSRINISAHKLLPGQFGGIHTDNLPGETHRVVVQLNRGRADDSGGNLVFLSGPSPNDLAIAFKQVSNSAAGFRLGPQSHHAITKVKTGTRFTVIYTFLSDAAKDSEYRYFVAA
jgi:hypothetical protein